MPVVRKNIQGLRGVKITAGKFIKPQSSEQLKELLLRKQKEREAKK